MPHPTEPVAVRHPETGQYITLDPAIDYDPGNVLVKSYPWAFAARDTSEKPVESVSIEQATAEPGQKRARTKPAK
jgi:hypothetical protein